MPLNSLQKRARIKSRVRGKISGTSERPRLSVFRSNKEIYAQVINDDNNVTLVSASSYKKGFAKGTKTEQAQLVGKEIAEVAKKAGINKVVFDRNGYIYHGRIKALADAARENGLEF